MIFDPLFSDIHSYTFGEVMRECTSERPGRWRVKANDEYVKSVDICKVNELIAKEKCWMLMQYIRNFKKSVA